MTPFPAPNRLHVWWARRPLVASRAAVLASLLPADADRERFLHVLGIHGDPVAAKAIVERARRTGQRVDNPYGYGRAFSHSLEKSERDFLKQHFDRSHGLPNVLDPVAGGGSIPFEAVRLGLNVQANDLNSVAALVMKATVEWPLQHSEKIEEEFRALAEAWRAGVQARIDSCYPQRDAPDRADMTYLWARTVACPHCGGRVPLSPNWRLAPDGTGVRLKPHLAAEPGERVCSFEIVAGPREQSAGTVARGDAVCPFGDCRRVIEGSEI